MGLLNLWREGGGRELPTIGLLRLGTGNGWARGAGAPEFFSHVRRLARLNGEMLQVQEVTLVEVVDRLCPFAGVGWDARILNDYQRNLGRRAAQPVGSRLASWLHKGVHGYLYSLARITIPEEWMRLRREGQATVALENVGPEVFGVDGEEIVPLPGAKQLHQGPISVGAASSVREWGYGIRAFPRAGLKPGFINVRIYGGHVLDALLNARRIWRGLAVAGVHEWLATGVRMRFSRPMPLQVGGDPMGERSEIVLRAARERVRVVDWRAAFGAR